jgi:D-glycero-alpha-D-manno-heptose-7-phosphate kinase
VADLPARTGLGTSSAFTVGLLLGLYALRDQMRNKHALAMDAIDVEQNVIGEAVGSQDQASAAYGGFNRINFNTDGSLDVRQMVASRERLAMLEQHCALFFTGFSRTASEIAKEQIRLTPNRKKELGMMFQMVNEAEAIVTDPKRSLHEFGALMHESWQLKRTLTQNITNSALDEIYQAGRSAGAIGGKLLGAGGGGFMLFFVPPERRQALRARLKNLLCVPISFSNRGSHVVVHEPEQVYDESLTSERSEVYAHQPSREVSLQKN